MKTLFHRDRIRPHRDGAADRTRQPSKRTFYQHCSSKNELVEGYLRRIHHAGGMPTEQAIDTADASPRSRPLPPSIAPWAAVSGVHFTTPPSRQVRNVN